MTALLPMRGGGVTGHFETESARGRWLALLYWPRDFALLCAMEWRTLRTLVAGFAETSTQFLAVARGADLVRGSEPWPGLAGELPFPVLIDEQGALASALGLDPERAGCSLRATFLADPEATIRWVSVSDHAAAGSMREAAEVLRALQGCKPADPVPTGLISMCAWCRRVRDDGGWHGAEAYIRRLTGTDFTHGICRDCLDEQRPR
jgi:alkyl hydroperoxide reductase subunit AhpC